ncbi:mavicyanin [Lactuca sativa]|nr:mavicyanin [Lactuca sativa]
MEKMTVAALLISMVVYGSQMKTTFGALYMVGDSAGWTTIGNVNYKQWAATKTFQFGDTIVFTYNKQFHNVMQVKHGDYRSCNVSAPIATHSTGNDSIVIKTYGHHYYLCAVPGHCQAGQKLDINVQRLSSTLAPTPSPSSSPSSSSPSPSSTPSSATASKPNSIGKVTATSIKLGFAIALLAAVSIV